MNKHNAQFILKYLLLIVIALSSGCRQSIITDSPVLTPVASQTPINTITPSPTNTPEPIHPKGSLIYSDYGSIYSVDLQSQEVKLISVTDQIQDHMFISQNNIYITRTTKMDEIGLRYQDEVFKLSLDGTKTEQLTSDGVRLIGVAPTGDYLTYVDNDFESSINRLVLLDINQKKPYTIAEEKDYSFNWLSWSPDGKMFLYFEELTPAYDNSHNHLFLYNVDEKKSTELLPGNSVGIVGITKKAWSSDGKHIVLNLDDDSEAKVYIYNIENGDLSLIANNQPYSYGGDYAWSPGGNQLAISLWINNQFWLYIVELGKGVVNKIPLIDYAGNISWSPNGKNILFQVSDRKTGMQDTFLQILNVSSNKIIDIQTQTSISLPSINGRTIEIIPWNYYAVWTPDSRFFAYFTTPNPGNYEEPRRLILNIQDMITDNHIEFEVHSIDTSWIKPTPFWIYSQ